MLSKTVCTKLCAYCKVVCSWSLRWLIASPSGTCENNYVSWIETVKELVEIFKAPQNHADR